MNITRIRILLFWAALFVGGVYSYAQDHPPNVLLMAQGEVEISKAGTTNWAPAEANQILRAGDRLRTLENSRAQIRLSNRALLPVNELSVLTIQEPQSSDQTPLFSLSRGSAYFLGRDKPRSIQFRTRTVAGAVRGTEFLLEIGADGETILTLVDGVVDLNNPQGSLTVLAGETATIEENRSPRKTARLESRKIVQWFLYYPAVLDPREIQWDGGIPAGVNRAIEHYNAGDLLKALDAFPRDRPSLSDGERLLLAALVLGVGQVGHAAEMLSQDFRSDRNAELSRAIQTLIHSVQQPGPTNEILGWKTSSGWLAESFSQQAQFRLDAARKAAMRATELDSSFGFAWARLAELEFSRGDLDKVRRSLVQAAKLSPRNPAALSLDGFMQAAAHRFDAALSAFDKAIEIDGAFANAWFGRGLVKIRKREIEAGILDLQTAAALEPQRAILRSYLGKAFNQANEKTNAFEELLVARRLDPKDPTAWLYSALLKQGQNEINSAIRDLERARILNDNRAVYRSRSLLDQDRAVAGANLASIYRDAGMTELSLRTASAAVQSDYANPSAHLFLANSYAAASDSRQINLRYESANFAEYLVANLISPAAFGPFSATISQQEYSRFFESDHFGFSSVTEYLSHGEWRQTAAQYGVLADSAYALEQIYRNDPGQRPNNDFEQLAFSLLYKQQLTPDDTFFLQTVYNRVQAGDSRQYYDPSSASPNLRAENETLPLALAGLHHQWQPGVHTLLLAGLAHDQLSNQEPLQSALIVGRRLGEIALVPVDDPRAPLDYQSHFTVYSGEIQQIFQQNPHTVVFGTRFQSGDFNTSAKLGRSTLTRFTGTQPILLPFSSPPIAQEVRADFLRFSAYGYETWETLPSLFLTAGLGYDYIEAPRNLRSPPLLGGEENRDQVSPKAGLVWHLSDQTTLRLGFSESLGGVSFDQSLRIEPTQVGGFNQTYRSLIPDSLAGAGSLPEMRTLSAGLDHGFSTGTYVGIEAQSLHSAMNGLIGAFDLTTVPFSIVPSSLREDLDFTENSLGISLNQMAGENLSFGASHRVARASLETFYPEIPSAVTPYARTEQTSILHETRLFAIFNHRSGIFARFETAHYNQSNQDFISNLGGDDFWQSNLFAGYRFPRRHAEIVLGILNLNGQDYRIYPLNNFLELPRQRTFTARLNLDF